MSNSIRYWHTGCTPMEHCHCGRVVGAAQGPQKPEAGGFHWLVQYLEKRISFYWIPSYVGVIGNEKADTAAKACLLGIVTNVPIPYGDFKKHINVLLKTQMAVSVG